ncbi:MAG: hypothetical protein L6Q98_12375 [Anaerolineae bacterium]|nr:hypothetical protein [Anaerolineae bacterium]NUQ06303.1 hypothetical protein [Anaerolineae bacterium]
MPKLPMPLNPDRSSSDAAGARSATFEARVACVMTHETLVKPEQVARARERLLARAAEQPMLPAQPPPRRRSLGWNIPFRLGWGFFSGVFGGGAYERMRLPVGMIHHYDLDRYYSYKLVNLPA